MDEVTVGLGVIVLLVGFPLLLLAMLALLGALERWMLEPDERATQVRQLLEGQREADDVEVAVTRLLAQLADRHEAMYGVHAADEVLPDRHSDDAADVDTGARQTPLNGHRPGD